LASALSILATLRSGDQASRPRATPRDDLITIGLGLWLMIGVFVDGWAHNNLPILETFFTPWHALLYSGFAACAAWIAGLIASQILRGRRGPAAVPLGYGLGMAGVLIFGAGGVGDMIWHTIFGIEKNIDALLSPTHLLLFLGGALILTSPFRSAWANPDAEAAPSFARLFPALLSLALVVSFASFMNMYFWPTTNGFADAGQWARQAARYPSAASYIQHQFAIEGLTGLLLANALLIGPMLLALRRWRLPLGAMTLLFGLNGALMAALLEFRASNAAIAMLAAGLFADALIRGLGAGPGRTGALRAVAALVPLATWGLYFLSLRLGGGVAWQVELWAGAIVMAMLEGLGLSVLVFPPEVPVGSGQETR
jgi:hypothetical protein